MYKTSLEQVMITSQQMRAARALLGLDQHQMAELAGLSLPTIPRLESFDGHVRRPEHCSHHRTAVGKAWGRGGRGSVPGCRYVVQVTWKYDERREGRGWVKSGRLGW